MNTYIFVFTFEGMEATISMKAKTRMDAEIAFGYMGLHDGIGYVTEDLC
jgi:hypothetical protein